MTPERLIAELDGASGALTRSPKAQAGKDQDDRRLVHGGGRRAGANSTHALDSVRAALEIQDFMMELAKEEDA